MSVTILSQQKFSSLEKPKVIISRRKCTELNKSGNQLLKLWLQCHTYQWLLKNVRNNSNFVFLHKQFFENQLMRYPIGKRNCKRMLMDTMNPLYWILIIYKKSENVKTRERQRFIFTFSICPIDVYILHSGSNSKNHQLLAFQRFKLDFLNRLERRAAFMKQLSSDLRHDPYFFQPRSI